MLTGGSAFGLAAADGVMAGWPTAGVGYPVGPDPAQVVPIVPAAVVFDLGRGGDFTARPDASFGGLAYDEAAGPGGVAVRWHGCVGAGTGAVAGGLKGGVGSASEVLPDGTHGRRAGRSSTRSARRSTCGTGELLGARHLLPGEVPALRRPSPDDLAAALAAAAARPEPRPPLATTLVVLGTDLALTKAQCQKVAGIGHDGLARAINPVHTMFDGDTVFALATGVRAAPDPCAFHALLGAAADCVTRAVVHAMLAGDDRRDVGRCLAQLFGRVPVGRRPSLRRVRTPPDDLAGAELVSAAGRGLGPPWR